MLNLLISQIDFLIAISATRMEYSIGKKTMNWNLRGVNFSELRLFQNCEYNFVNLVKTIELQMNSCSYKCLEENEIPRYTYPLINLCRRLVLISWNFLAKKDPTLSSWEND